MKLLYAIQGTGNGHISRARDIIPALRQYAEVDVLLSGTQAELRLPFPIKYSLHGLGFIFGKKGGIDFYQTYVQSKSARFWQDVRQIPVADYDLVISDFEPVSAWACRLRKQACIALSHQSAVLAPEAPKPSHIDFAGYLTLRHYAPAARNYGFHFQAYNERTFLPLIRRQVRQAACRAGSHYTVYLPAYSEAYLVRFFSAIPNVRWEIFSKHSRTASQTGNIHIRPVQDHAFIESLSSCKGLICGAGFETPAEALYLGKPLLVIPMKHQFEQACNAAALAALGVGVLKDLKTEQLPHIRQWIEEGKSICLDYEDQTAQIVEKIIEEAESSNTLNLKGAGA